MGLPGPHPRARIHPADRRQGRYATPTWSTGSNVFPGVLGRTCDRPCEPACRRGRVEEEPVAICRLKRVAADYKDDVSARMPAVAAPKQRQARRLRRRRAGLADGGARPGAAGLRGHGVRRRGRPAASSARRSRASACPSRDRRGDRLHHSTSASSSGRPAHRRLKALLAEGYDAVFVGCGAPRGRDLDMPGRKEAAANIHIGIDWLASVSFGHITQVGRA
jgi:formate dehydrogenase (NADP+) beta subunit